jgi:hypothetical protein
LLVDWPYIRVPAHRSPAEGKVSLDLEWASPPEVRGLFGADDLEVGELANGGLVAHTSFPRDGVGVLGMKRTAVELQTFEHAEHEGRWHEETARKYLCQLLALDGRGPKYVFFTVEGEAVAMIQAPMTDLVRGRVALDWDRPLCRYEDPTDALRDERSEEVVHWQEGEPKAEVLADSEHIDLLGLINPKFV